VFFVKILYINLSLSSKS